MPVQFSIRALEPDDIPSCGQILRALPEWFGIEDAVVRYIRDLESLPSFVAVARSPEPVRER